MNVPVKVNLNPGVTQNSINADISSASSTAHVGLVGYLSGEVDGSYAGATGAQDLDVTQVDYFATLLGAYSGLLSAAQFGL